MPAHWGWIEAIVLVIIFACVMIGYIWKEIDASRSRDRHSLAAQAAKAAREGTGDILPGYGGPRPASPHSDGEHKPED